MVHLQASHPLEVNAQMFRGGTTHFLFLGIYRLSFFPRSLNTIDLSLMIVCVCMCGCYSETGGNTCRLFVSCLISATAKRRVHSVLSLTLMGHTRTLTHAHKRVGNSVNAHMITHAFSSRLHPAHKTFPCSRMLWLCFSSLLSCVCPASIVTVIRLVNDAVDDIESEGMREYLL